jgi:uncharacterized damage-inducible protein DinB
VFTTLPNTEFNINSGNNTGESFSVGGRITTQWIVAQNKFVLRASKQYRDTSLVNAGVTVCRYSVRFQRQEKYAGLTMIKDDIQLLYEYDRWANGRVLQAASALSPEQFTRDLGGSFVSVRDTLVHIIRSEWGWLTYWKSTSHSAAFLQDLWDEDNPLFRLGAFPDVIAVARKWAEVEKEQTEFVNSVTEEALRRTLPVLEKQLNLAHLMQHLANHSTYHRGQITSMIRRLGAEPLPTDFAFFLLERSSESANAS